MEDALSPRDNCEQGVGSPPGTKPRSADRASLPDKLRRLPDFRRNSLGKYIRSLESCTFFSGFGGESGGDQKAYNPLI
jgi:hypothetical protein